MLSRRYSWDNNCTTQTEEGAEPVGRCMKTPRWGDQGGYEARFCTDSTGALFAMPSSTCEDPGICLGERPQGLCMSPDGVTGTVITACVKYGRPKPPGNDRCWEKARRDDQARGGGQTWPDPEDVMTCGVVKDAYKSNDCCGTPQKLFWPHWLKASKAGIDRRYSVYAVC